MLINTKGLIKVLQSLLGLLFRLFLQISRYRNMHVFALFANPCQFQLKLLVFTIIMYKVNSVEFQYDD